MNNPLKSIKKLWTNSMKTKEDKHKEFIQGEFDKGNILKVGGAKNE